MFSKQSANKTDLIKSSSKSIDLELIKMRFFMSRKDKHALQRKFAPFTKLKFNFKTDTFLALKFGTSKNPKCKPK
jgi:hypothetical protein